MSLPADGRNVHDARGCSPPLNLGPEPPPSAMRILRALGSPSLGRLSAPLLPSGAVGEAGPHTWVLLRGIVTVLAERELAAA